MKLLFLCKVVCCKIIIRIEETIVMSNLCHISVPDKVFFVKFFVVNNYLRILQELIQGVCLQCDFKPNTVSCLYWMCFCRSSHISFCSGNSQMYSLQTMSVRKKHVQSQLQKHSGNSQMSLQGPCPNFVQICSEKNRSICCL